MDFVRNKAKHTKLRLVEIEDAAFIVETRQAGISSGYLSESPPGVAAQVAWLESYKVREAAGQEYYFVAIDERDERLGLLRLYDISESELWIGSWAIAKGAPIYAGIESAINIYETVFHGLDIPVCRYAVVKSNVRAINFYINGGAFISSEDGEKFYMEFHRDVFEKIWPEKYLKYYK